MKLDYMKKRFTILFIILCVCCQIYAQEQLTNIKTVDNAHSGPLYLGTIQEKTFFVTSNSTNSVTELWTTDGTESGTTSVKQIPRLVKEPYISDDVAIKGEYIYFLVSPNPYSTTYPELWRRVDKQ